MEHQPLLLEVTVGLNKTQGCRKLGMQEHTAGKAKTEGDRDNRELRQGGQ